MALRAVADTNIYVSSFQFGGRISEILDLAAAGTIDLFISAPIVRELSGVLSHKFGWSADRIQQMRETLFRFAHLVAPAETVRVCSDPDDDRILECALEARAGLIISGDEHLLAMGDFQGIPIVSPREFLDSTPWRD